MRFRFARTEFTKSTVQCTADTAWMNGLRQSTSWTTSFEGTARKRNKCANKVEGFIVNPTEIAMPTMLNLKPDSSTYKLFGKVTPELGGNAQKRTDMNS